MRTNDYARLCTLVVGLMFLPLAVHAQRGGGAAPPTPQAGAPFDMTGYWVSVISQDWRLRMVVPPKGDYMGIPLNVASKKVADAWDPAKDEAAGEQCKSYGAPALMGVPGRLRISWQSDTVLKVEADAGIQTRLLHFDERRDSKAAPRSWQGESVAQWQVPGRNVSLLLQPTRALEGRAAPPPDFSRRNGALRVVTTNLRAGYLRKNGVPYSADTTLLEYWDLFRPANGDQWLMVTSEVTDPVYLREPRLVTYPFKKEANANKWDPTPCSARW